MKAYLHNVRLLYTDDGSIALSKMLTQQYVHNDWLMVIIDGEYVPMAVSQLRQLPWQQHSIYIYKAPDGSHIGKCTIIFDFEPNAIQRRLES